MMTMRHCPLSLLVLRSCYPPLPMTMMKHCSVCFSLAFVQPRPFCRFCIKLSSHHSSYENNRTNRRRFLLEKECGGVRGCMREGVREGM